MKKLFFILIALFLANASCEESEEPSEEKTKSFMLSFRPQLGEYHDGSVTIVISNVGTKNVGNYNTIYWTVDEGNYTVTASGTGFMGITKSISVSSGSPKDYVITGGFSLGDWPEIVSR